MSIIQLETLQRVQTRVKVNHAKIKEYATLYQDGQDFPPIIIYYDGVNNYLADGNHRLDALILNGLKEIDTQAYRHFEIRNGDKRDATYCNIVENSLKGLPMSNADKKNAACIFLNEWPEIGDREIARTIGIDHKTVGKYRKLISAGLDPMNSDKNRESENSDTETDTDSDSSVKKVKVDAKDTEIETLKARIAELEAALAAEVKNHQATYKRLETAQRKAKKEAKQNAICQSEITF